jgi:hypothetical protein
VSQPQLRRAVPAGQDEHETIETLFRNIDLSFAKTTIESCFHLKGPRRPPRNPLGIFRMFIVMRMKGVRSLREMTRLLDVDQRLRKLCLVRAGEKAYFRSVLSRFTRKIGEDNLNKIIKEKVVLLLSGNLTEEIDVVLDASFIKAWSTRDPLDNQTGYSDKEARVGRTGRSYALDYKLHLAIDSKMMLPLSIMFENTGRKDKAVSLTYFNT